MGAEKARETRKELGIGRRLKSLQTRMEDVKPPERPNWPDLYVLYRICCLASHPALRVWGRYRVVGSATVSSEPMDHKFLTPELGSWMAAASALYLVSHCYCVTETGRLGELTDWWNTKAAPLLC